MPKRLIDDSMLSSPSLAKCSPRAQDAFPRFILLADDFGCFEVVARSLVGKGWPKRNDVSEADVVAWLNEYVDAGMACLYTALERRICYLTGWNGPHGQKKRAEYDPNAPAGTPGRHGSKRHLPAPDPALVAAVVAGARRDADGKAPGTDREDTEGNPSDSAPARETAGSRSVPAAVPVVPGPVVPVPGVVPVPDAGASTAPSLPGVHRIPTRNEAYAAKYPKTDALLTALSAREQPGAWPAKSETRRAVEDAIGAQSIEAVATRAAWAINATGKPWLGHHLDAIRPPKPARTHGDLGAELRPWRDLLTREELAAAADEIANRCAPLDPELTGAPLGITGIPTSPAYGELLAITAKWRAVAEARS